jgi:sulfatase maturation enzyme AslB (radical SAM superfamily)
MEFGAKVKATVPENMEAIYDRHLDHHDMCETTSDDCQDCPWDMYGEVGCARVAVMADEDERALACCFMQAIAELGTNY